MIQDIQEEQRMNKSAQAGRKGPNVRSDCWVKIMPTNSGGIQFGMISKVKVLYGKSIEELVRDGLYFFEVENAVVELEDNGALPFVIMARIETAIRRLKLDQGREWLPEFRHCCQYETSRERFRRSRLYLPGNESKFMLNAGLHKPDGLILDLEDSVAPAEKDAAQLLVRNALLQVDFYGAERMVRINQIPEGLDDLKFIVPYNVHVILIPKCESADQVKQVDEEVHKILVKNKIIRQILQGINQFEGKKIFEYLTLPRRLPLRHSVPDRGPG